MPVQEVGKVQFEYQTPCGGGGGHWGLRNTATPYKCVRGHRITAKKIRKHRMEEIRLKTCHWRVP